MSIPEIQKLTETFKFGIANVLKYKNLLFICNRKLFVFNLLEDRPTCDKAECGIYTVLINVLIYGYTIM